MGSLSHSAENFGLSTRSSAPSLSEKKGRQGREPAGLLNFGKGFHMSLAGMCENCEKYFPSSSLPEKEKQLITISQRYFPSQAIKILGLGLRLNLWGRKALQRKGLGALSCACQTCVLRFTWGGRRLAQRARSKG